jgi:hypothetical protein
LMSIYNNNFFILGSFLFIYLSTFLFFKKNNHFALLLIILYDIFLNPLKLLLFYQIVFLYIIINFFKNVKIDIYLLLFFNMVFYAIELKYVTTQILLLMIVLFLIKNYNLKWFRKY